MHRRGTGIVSDPMQPLAPPVIPGAAPVTPAGYRERTTASMNDTDDGFYLASFTSVLGRDGHAFSLLCPIHFDGEPSGTELYSYDVPVKCVTANYMRHIMTRDQSPFSRSNSFGVGSLLSSTSALHNHYLAVPENSLPMPYVQTEEERVALMEKLQALGEEIVALKAALAQDQALVSYRHLDLITKELHFMYISDAVFTSTLDMNAAMLEAALDIKARVQPTLRAIRATNLEEPDVRAPAEIAGRRSSSSLLCVSADRLLQCYINAFRSDRQRTDLKDSLKNANREDLRAKMSKLQPDALLNWIARNFKKPVCRMFPTAESLEIDATVTESLGLAEGRSKATRVISIGLLPVVLAFFEVRMQLLNPISDVCMFLVEYFHTLIPRIYPEEEHLEMFLQMRHNAEWARRYTRYAATTDTYVWQAMRITNAAHNRYFQVVQSNYTRALEVAIGDADRVREIAALVVKTVRDHGVKPMMEAEFLEISNVATSILRQPPPAAPQAPSLFSLTGAPAPTVVAPIPRAVEPPRDAPLTSSGSLRQKRGRPVNPESQRQEKLREKRPRSENDSGDYDSKNDAAFRNHVPHLGHDQSSRAEAWNTTGFSRASEASVSALSYSSSSNRGDPNSDTLTPPDSGLYSENAHMGGTFD